MRLYMGCSNDMFLIVRSIQMDADEGRIAVRSDLSIQGMIR